MAIVAMVGEYWSRIRGQKDLDDRCQAEHGDVESHTLLADEKIIKRASSSFPKVWVFFTLINLVILIVSGLLLLNSPCRPFRERNSILKATSWWSPILDDIDIPQYITTINGTFFPRPDVSIARETPSADNDAKWDKFNRIKTHAVSREDILRLGKNPDKVAKFDDEYWGFGEDAYMVQLDVMHQIHCLDLLRRAAFADYPGYSPPAEAHDRMWWMHLGHCTDLILQNIQCNANTEVLTVAWVEDHDVPWPDFSIQRKCRSFDTILDWQRKNAVDEEKFGRMPMPKTAFVWPAPWQSGSELGEKLGNHHQQEGL